MLYIDDGCMTSNGAGGFYIIADIPLFSIQWMSFLALWRTAVKNPRARKTSLFMFNRRGNILLVVTLD